MSGFGLEQKSEGFILCTSVVIRQGRLHGGGGGVRTPPPFFWGGTLKVHKEGEKTVTRKCANATHFSIYQLPSPPF